MKEILENIWFRLYCDSTMSKKYGIELGENECKILLDCITNLQEENTKLKELCDKYEEKHSTTFQIWKYNKDTYKEENERLNNIIDELEKYFAKPNKFIERPERMKILNKLNELKGDNK